MRTRNTMSTPLCIVLKAMAHSSIEAVVNLSFLSVEIKKVIENLSLTLRRQELKDLLTHHSCIWNNSLRLDVCLDIRGT